MSYIKSKGDATLADIVRFIKETVGADVGARPAAYMAPAHRLSQQKCWWLIVCKPSMAAR